jgi:hypothetical protein
MEETTLSVAHIMGRSTFCAFLFRPESPTVPREAGDGLDSPGGLRTYSRETRKRERGWTE